MAAEATQILEENIEKGTGTAANIGCPAGGKTGTTDDFTDAWFVGFTPRLTTSVWVGHAGLPKTMPGGSGGVVAAPIWGQYMKVAKGGFCGDFPKPTEPFESKQFNGKLSRSGPPGWAPRFTAPQTTPTTPGGTGGGEFGSNTTGDTPATTSTPVAPPAQTPAVPPTSAGTGGAGAN